MSQTTNQREHKSKGSKSKGGSSRVSSRASTPSDETTPLLMSDSSSVSYGSLPGTPLGTGNDFAPRIWGQSDDDHEEEASDDPFNVTDWIVLSEHGVLPSPGSRFARSGAPSPSSEPGTLDEVPVLDGIDEPPSPWMPALWSFSGDSDADDEREESCPPPGREGTASPAADSTGAPENESSVWRILRCLPLVSRVESLLGSLEWPQSGEGSGPDERTPLLSSKS